MSTPPHLAALRLATVAPDDFDAFHQAVQRGFQEEMPPEAVDFDRALYEPGRFFGFQADGRWVATFGAGSRRVTVPGGSSLPMGAVTAVTVSGPYRRRGLLTEMMRRQFADSRRRGEPVAGLFASESVIYGRFGYGQAAPRARLSGQTRSIRLRPDVAEPGGSVDEVTREQYLATAPRLHDLLLPARPGSLDRPERWWPMAIYDLQFYRSGATALRYLLSYDQAGKVDGHATYRIKEDYGVTGPNSEVQIGEVEAATPGAHARLWRYLTNLDLVRNFLRRSAAVDDVLRHLVTDPRAVHTEVVDGLYLRILDVAAVLSARRYVAEIDLVIDVRDAMVPQNAGRYRLQADGDGVAVRRVRRRPDIGLDVRELGSVLLGGTSLSTLHAAGLVAEHRPGAVAAASVAFSWPVAPFCADIF